MIAARGEMYHALTSEDMQADRGREFLVIEISNELGDKLRALAAEDRHRLQNDLLRRLDSKHSTPIIRCPNCLGHTTVSKPPWVAGDIPEWVGITTGDLYPCPTCKAAGWVVVREPA